MPRRGTAVCRTLSPAGERMISIAQEGLRRMRTRRAFRRAMLGIRDGLPQADVLALLGPPDGVYSGDDEAGLDYSWGYHERLPEHRDLIIAFAGDVVCYSSIRHIPDARQREECRNLARSYSA